MKPKEQIIGKLKVGQELYYSYRRRGGDKEFGYCKITYVGKKYFMTDRPGRYRDEKTEIARMGDGSLSDRSVSYYASKEAYEQSMERRKRIAAIKNYNLWALPIEIVNKIYELLPPV